MKFQDDSYYIGRILAGDVSAYSSLVTKYKNLVFTIVHRILNNREDAEEVAQDVFVKVYQSLNKFEQKSKFSTWLYRIAYNAAISKTRTKKVVFLPLEESVVTNYSTDEVMQGIHAIDDSEKTRMLERALQSLPADDHLLITLFYKGENSVEDISYVTGLSMSNVKVRLHRIRKKLYEGMMEMAVKN